MKFSEASHLACLLPAFPNDKRDSKDTQNQSEKGGCKREEIQEEGGGYHLDDHEKGQRHAGDRKKKTDQDQAPGSHLKIIDKASI
jgi:hypothetical protein